MALQIHAKAAEVKLVEALNALDDPAGWFAVYFHLDGLREEYKSDYQVKIALNLLNDLLKSYSGAVFVMSDRGMVVLCEEVEKPLQNKLIFQLRYLYMDDPLAYTENGQENPSFCTVYSLKTDFREFLDVASRRMTISGRKAGARGNAESTPVKPLSGGKVLDLSASRLASLEDDLRQADISKVVRRQPICALLPGMDVRRVFDELYIHIAHLRQSLKSDVDFFSNRWLFKYLTQILDARMLELLARDPKQFVDHPVSVNLNAETLLSSTFSDFDHIVPPAAKVGIVIEVPVVDVFADIAGFLIAKKEVQKMGYRVCLDGLSSKSLMQIDREKLGVDLLKVQWNADAESDLESQENRDLAAAIQRCGNKRIILCRCDTRQAIEYGQALGVPLFQGRYIDHLINPAVAMEN